MVYFDIMPLDEAKRVIREATESALITHYPSEYGGEGNAIEEQEFYPYCILPIETRTETVFACTSALAHMYKRLFEDKGVDVTTAVYPEAKAFFFPSDFERFSGLDGIPPRKRDYHIGSQFEITINPPYRKPSKLYCFIRKSDRSLIIVDDMISGASTQEGHIRAFEEQGKEKLGHELYVPGGISVYERGNGLDEIRKKFPDKSFAGFARLEIIPREEKLPELGKAMGYPEEEDMPSLYINMLYRELGDLSYEEKNLLIIDNFVPSVPYFFDEMY
jgi:adenine/guanine phosphoribosyltransferase-like PRPP-binding protein